jgi:hypothetical protein
MAHEHNASAERMHQQAEYVLRSSFRKTFFAIWGERIAIRRLPTDWKFSSGSASGKIKASRTAGSGGQRAAQRAIHDHELAS